MRYFEIFSLIVFAIVYYAFDIIKASFALSLLSLLILPYLLRLRLRGENKHDFSILSNVLMVIMGGMTAITGDSSIIKMKPSILYLSLAFAIYFFSSKEIFFIKKLFEKILILEDTEWKKLSMKFVYFFILLALLNEIIWRNFAESTWVSFKTIACPMITLLFFMGILYLNRKNMIGKS